MRTSRGVGHVAGTEVDVFAGPAAAWTGNLPPLVYCHGSGDNADTVWNKTGQRAVLRGIAEGYAVAVCDLGGETFGNDTAVTRIGQAKAWLNSLGADGPVVLVAQSAGALSALAYTFAHPEDVSAVAASIPALDIADVYAATNGTGVPALIDAAYGTYNDATHGPTHSPVQFAHMLPDIPIALWAADNDTAARPGPVNTFVAARPSTELTWVGNLGHTEAAVTAAAPALIDWVLAL